MTKRTLFYAKNITVTCGGTELKDVEVRITATGRYFPEIRIGNDTYSCRQKKHDVYDWHCIGFSKNRPDTDCKINTAFLSDEKTSRFLGRDYYQREVYEFYLPIEDALKFRKALNWLKC